jgi:integrase
LGKAHKLTALTVDRLKTPGVHGDGAGLCLKVTEAGSKYWILRYMRQGKQRWMGIGSYPDVSLANARDAASEARKKIRLGIDPIDERKAEQSQERASRAKEVSFDWCAEQFINSHKSGWRNAKHADQWAKTLKTYASPILGDLSVAQIDTAHVMKILEPIWQEKAETASRLRGRIESVLDWATVRKYRVGENPARWKGHLDKLLPASSKVRKTEHHPAQPWPKMAEFMTSVAKQEGVAARAIEFVILTAARSGEVRGATWSEVDLDAAIWIVPADRMKSGKEHRVPLTAAAVRILRNVKELVPDNEFIFPGMRGTPLSDMSLTAVLRRMDRRDITVHGFRSSFRDWAAEATTYPSDLVEMALAHTIGNKVEAAYRRGDMVEKRRHMMEEWAGHCEAAPAQK